MPLGAPNKASPLPPHLPTSGTSSETSGRSFVLDNRPDREEQELQI